MIRTGCDTDDVDVLDEACCAGTVVFAADDDEHETVEASAWTNVVLAADENGDGPNETTDLGTKQVGAKGCTDNTDDEDDPGGAGSTDIEAGSAGGTDPTKDKDETVDAGTDIEAIAEDENESGGAGTGTDAKAVAEGCTDSAEDEDEHGVAGTEIETDAEGCTTDSTEVLVGEGTDSEIDAVDAPSHCSIPAESKQTFEFVQSAKQSTFLSKR